MFSRASRTDFRPSPSIVRVVAMRSGSRWPNNSSPRGARGHRPEGARGASQGRRRHVQRRRRHQGHGEWRRRRASRRPSSRRIATSDAGHQVAARHAQADRRGARRRGGRRRPCGRARLHEAEPESRSAPHQSRQASEPKCSNRSGRWRPRTIARPHERSWRSGLLRSRDGDGMQQTNRRHRQLVASVHLSS